jgi:hypothetical protein
MGENRYTRRKTCPRATSVTINSAWTGLGSNPGICSEKQVTNNLSGGMAPALCSECQEYSLLQCGAVYLDVWLSTFERNQLPPLSG